MTSFYDFGIDVKGRTNGQFKTVCPKCSPERRNKKDPCLSVNISEGVWNCHHCAWNGSLKKVFTPYTPPKVYKKPTLMLEPVKGAATNYLNERGIIDEVLKRNNVSYGKEWMPQTGKEESVIIFPYFKNGELVNAKFRDGAKNFKQSKGAEKVFFKIDDIKNTDTEEGGTDFCIITEGEIDALSFEVAGFWNAISVPDGAPQKKLQEGSKKLEYFDNCYTYFDKMKTVYLALDSDNPGKILRDELARRIGKEKCMVVPYPDDCKDANEVLCKHGEEELQHCLAKAESYPLDGVIQAHELKDDVMQLYFDGLKPGDKIGHSGFDELASFPPSHLTIITGIPNHGKSAFLDHLMVRLALRSDWKFGVFSAENNPMSYHIKQLSELIIGKPFKRGFINSMTANELERAIEIISERIFFIRPEDDRYTLNNIMESAKQLTKQKGIKGFIIDPYNRIELEMKSLNEHQFINSMLTKLNIMKNVLGLHIFLVAHPRKMQKKHNSSIYEVPTLYDIAGSSHFYNQADAGITVYRNFDKGDTEVYVQKCRFKHIGKVGFSVFNYNKANSRYYVENESQSNNYEEGF